MKKIIILLFLIFTTFPIKNVSADYRLPFQDNQNLKFSQTWHMYGSYYSLNSNNTYVWNSGADYAVDIENSSASNAIIVAPEEGVVKYRDDCAKSTNLVIVSGGYEFQLYHLDNKNMSVTRGSIISKNQVLGKLYPSNFEDGCGKSFGSHLHFRFQTKQGNNDTNRKYLSGYYFDEYDGTSSSGGASGCIMHKDDENYCLAGYGGTQIFTANEPAGAGCNGTNPVITNWVVTISTSCDAVGSLTIQPVSTLNPNGGTITLKTH